MIFYVWWFFSCFFICFTCASSNWRSMVNSCSEYFPYAELSSLSNVCCIVAMMFIWFDCLLLRDYTFVECRSEKYLILYERLEFWLEFVMRHIKLPCWECLDGWERDLVLKMQYLCWIFCGVASWFTHMYPIDRKKFVKS